jgi:protein-tyrosine phosphatase
MPYWIHTGTPLHLATAARPRGGDWLEDEIRSLHREGVDVLVSLLTDDENQELDLTQEGALCRAAGMEFRSFPIPDRETPESKEQFLRFIESLGKEADAGLRIVLHCRAGIGRSSLVAAALMVRAGFTPDDAFDRISKARGHRVPDTGEQIDWLKRLGTWHDDKA